MNIPSTPQQASPKAPFQAGKFYPAGQRKRAASSFSFLPDNPRLELFIPSPAEKVLTQFCEGGLQMALVRHGAAAVLLYRFGSLPWHTAVCDGDGLGHQRRRVFQALARERSLPFHFSAGIIDRDTRAVLAVRHAMLSPMFASLIGKAMRAADGKAADLAAQAADLDWLMTQHPGDLLSLSSIYERATPLTAEEAGPPGERAADD